MKEEKEVDDEREGRLYGVDYDGGKVSAVMILDTDDAVKAFVPLMNGKFEDKKVISCGNLLRNSMDVVEGYCSNCKRYAVWLRNHIEPNYCQNCGARMNK